VVTRSPVLGPLPRTVVIPHARLIGTALDEGVGPHKHSVGSVAPYVCSRHGTRKTFGGPDEPSHTRHRQLESFLLKRLHAVV